MICDIDIWQAAQDLILRYGAAAARHAAIRADECLDAGDAKSQKAWLEILRVATELQQFSAAESARRTVLLTASSGVEIVSPPWPARSTRGRV